MIKTTEELKTQAKKINLTFWEVHNCSMCGYKCGYIISDDNVFYDAGCDCVSYNDTQEKTWDELTETYNRNQPENNPEISLKYLQELDKIWEFRDAK